MVETLKVKGAERPVTEFDERTLKWFANECKNRRSSDIAKRELARRAGGGAPVGVAKPTQAITTRQQDALVIEGSFGNPAQATAALKAASEAYHLITPATMVGALLEGCAVELHVVRIRPDDPHLYRVGDKLALDKTHLAQLGTLLGASMVHSRRTDDGSHPHFREANVRVKYPLFDGTWIEREGSVDFDLRAPDGPEYVDAIAKAEEKNRDPKKQLREMRRFIWRHAESRALNRAFAACGIRRSYTKEELERPFCVARLAFTGHSEDPVARAHFREGIMHRFLGSSSAAYGPERSPRQLVEAAPSPQAGAYAQPPTFYAEGEDIDEEPPPDEDPEPEQRGTAAPAQQPAAGEVDRGDNPDNY
jgi:hypothetical protein